MQVPSIIFSHNEKGELIETQRVLSEAEKDAIEHDYRIARADRRIQAMEQAAARQASRAYRRGVNHGTK